ncbi:reverse transcriptase domain-containing protein [Tanacetum coccineum]
MKKSIAEFPMMTAPQEKEELIIYLAAAKEVISVILMTERDGKQIPIYFVNRALRGPEINYTPMEKLVLALMALRQEAYSLSQIASTSFAHLSKQVLVEELKEKSISAAEVLVVVEQEGDTWMTPIFKYLMDGTLSAEGKKARAVKRKSWRFSIINGILYKKILPRTMALVRRTTPGQLCSKRDT